MRYRVDLSTGMLEKAKQNADNKELEIDFFHGDAENLPFEDNSFDLVTNKFLLWTLQQPSCAVREWKRVLKPGGKIFAIGGDWFNPRPSRRVKRTLSEWIEKFVKKNQIFSFNAKVVSFEIFIPFSVIIASASFFISSPLPSRRTTSKQSS